MAPQRVRRKHNKVRTGCLTCKIRRKKCDETYPSCARCTETGRKCDGYATIVTGKSGNISDDGTHSYLSSTTPVSPLKKIPNPNCGLLCSKRTDRRTTKYGGTRTLQPKAINPPVADYIPTETHNERIEQDEKHHRRYKIICNDMEFESDVALEELFDFEFNRSVETHFTEAMTNVRLLHVPNALAEIPRISDLESHCVSYFHHRTVPRLTTYFESSLWRMDLVRGALAVPHPVLFFAITALGAVHRRLSLGISREAFEYCRHAANLYKRAVRALEQVKQSFHGNSAGFGVPEGNVGLGTESLIATSEILLGIFQGFQTEYSASSKHLATGVKYAIGRPLKIVHSERCYCPVPAKPRVICQMMYSLYCGATQLFGTSVRFLGYCPFRNSSIRSLPEVFNNLEDMRDHLFTIVESIWRDMHQGWDNPELHWQEVKAQELRLRRWNSAAAQTVATCDMVREPWQKQAFSLLHLTRSMAYLVIYANSALACQHDIGTMPDLPVFPADDQIADLADAACLIADAVEHFRVQDSRASLSEIKWVIEDVMNKYEILRFGDETSPGNSSTIIGNYRLADTVFELNQKSRAGDVTEMLGLFSIARRISEIEERAAIELIRGVIPPEVDSQYIDIACILLDPRKVIVRYYAPHPSGEGFIWVWESWLF